MAIKFTNNASAELANSINNSVTTIVVAAGQGAKFPSLGVGDYFYATLVDPSNNLEIVKVTARATDTLTVERAQDGTTAKAYNAGDRIELRPVAAAFNGIVGDISSALTLKADLDSPALTGVPTAPTAAPGTNTTQIATTAFVQAARTAVLEAVYPVGSIYTNAINSTNPGTLLGFGTWVAFGAGRMMVGHNASDPLFDTAEETGGSKDAIVVSHTHSATSSVSDPGHSHTINNYFDTASFPRPGLNASALNNQNAGATSNSNTTGITVSTTVASTGSSGTNANLPPYITVYIWKRTA